MDKYEKNTEKICDQPRGTQLVYHKAEMKNKFVSLQNL